MVIGLINMKNFEFKKSLGQNFLIDENIKRKIVNSADVCDDSLIIEVGPGSGAITKYLVKFGVPVIAFEIDERLKSDLESIDADNLEIIFQDFLKVDLDKVLSKYKYKRIHLIANLPYYITTPIITKVMKETKIDEMIIMVQKEVGDRFKAMPNSREYNSLSVFLQYYFDISKVTLVSRNSFVPKPNVDSIVVKFTRKESLLEVKDLDFFFKFVRDAFTQKRKNLRNNLKNYDLLKIQNALILINKDLTFRAEQLSLEDFVYVANSLCE